MRPSLGTLSLLGDAYLGLDRVDEARRAFERVLDGHRSTSGPDHPLTLFASTKLGFALRRSGEHEQAKNLLLGVQAIATEVLEADHPIMDMLRIIQQD
ncbi:tetratricopeptide repeat protein [Lentzea sp. BCCO 10_0798]|uniref:Tetratricopeptide repeat protein n=1 Tax=Lentzea kristufekii TaxID=3095430 RepID=A0ABU4U376_9PSEU|nr:tetratricopeptide repeat protein [Lentzea sp. BCCO 10_0798]MDX8054719.1 tetratricopeptide repeat protein [Lentzea sp. BCCO 10_0798]